MYKFTDGATDSDLVTSIYFDSPGRQLYEGRLKKFDGAIALRVRWYGPTPAHDDIVYMERKVHREGTPCRGPSPRALPLPLPLPFPPPFPLLLLPFRSDRPSTNVFFHHCLADLVATLQIGSTRVVLPPRSAFHCGLTRWAPFRWNPDDDL